MYVVLLNHGRLLAIKREWIEFPILKTFSKVFFSSQKDVEANFGCPIMQVFSREQTACYLALICRQFDSKSEAKNYIRERYALSNQICSRIDVDGSKSPAPNHNKQTKTFLADQVSVSYESSQENAEYSIRTGESPSVHHLGNDNIDDELAEMFREDSAPSTSTQSIYMSKSIAAANGKPLESNVLMPKSLETINQIHKCDNRAKEHFLDDLNDEKLAVQGASHTKRRRANLFRNESTPLAPMSSRENEVNENVKKFFATNDVEASAKSRPHVNMIKSVSSVQFSHDVLKSIESATQWSSIRNLSETSDSELTVSQPRVERKMDATEHTPDVCSDIEVDTNMSFGYDATGVSFEIPNEYHHIDPPLLPGNEFVQKNSSCIARASCTPNSVLLNQSVGSIHLRKSKLLPAKKCDVSETVIMAVPEILVPDIVSHTMEKFNQQVHMYNTRARIAIQTISPVPVDNHCFGEVSKSTSNTIDQTKRAPYDTAQNSTFVGSKRFGGQNNEVSPEKRRSIEEGFAPTPHKTHSYITRTKTTRNIQTEIPSMPENAHSSNDISDSTSNPNGRPKRNVFARSSLSSTSKQLTADTLSPVQLRNLKEIDGSESADSKFVGLLLGALFETSILKVSSYRGGSSNFNKKSHLALDKVKLQIVKKMFADRVKNDPVRMKMLGKYINKKCNNLRRNK